MNIYLNFDDVLVKTTPMFIARLNNYYGVNKTIDEVYRTDFRDAFPRTNPGEIIWFSMDKNLLSMAEPMEHLYEFIRLLNKHNTCLISYGCPTSLDLKSNYTWNRLKLRCSFRMISSARPNNRFCVNMDGGIFIDTNIECMRTSNAAIKILFMPYGEKECNQYDNKDGVYTANTLLEVMDIINFFSEYKETMI